MNLLDLVTTCEIYPEDAKFETRTVGQPGRERQMRTQCGYYKRPCRRHPEFFKFSLPDDQPGAYPPGLYFIHPDSFETDGYDGLTLSRFNFRLIPVPQEAGRANKNP